MMHGRYTMFAGRGILGGILSIIIFILVIYFLIRLFDKNKSNSNTLSTKNNAIEILNERYARGEIDEEEYKNKLNNVKENI